MQLAATFICCKKGLKVGVKTRNIAQQQCRKTSCMILLPFCRSLTSAKKQQQQRRQQQKQKYN